MATFQRQILTGCGRRDGAQVHEAVHTMMHLHRRNTNASLFAPAARIERLYDAMTGWELENVAPRFMLNESARLTWDRVQPFDNLRVEDHQGLIIPGGIGIFPKRQSDLVRMNRFLVAGERMGATLVYQNIFRVLHDTNYHIYSSPSVLTMASPPERIYYNISQGIGNLVDQMVQSLGDNE
ncbi:ES1 protein homolog, mitochondrial-like [Trichogramma pretiosum]|uniref:ES1 protein homolog, mitochondrial-like n=1 Tax=Trichogramma pretiosum TaxID=7493 RepID=UPI0006C99CF6|nr:ES1 protein homolog, mitochondrial-like [Trichogramma pretiosum]